MTSQAKVLNCSHCRLIEINLSRQPLRIRVRIGPGDEDRVLAAPARRYARQAPCINMASPDPAAPRHHPHQRTGNVRPGSPLYPTWITPGSTRSKSGLAPCRNGGYLAPRSALVAQLDRVLDYESRGRGFESSPARQSLLFRNSLQPDARHHSNGRRLNDLPAASARPRGTSFFDERTLYKSGWI